MAVHAADSHAAINTAELGGLSPAPWRTERVLRLAVRDGNSGKELQLAMQDWERAAKFAGEGPCPCNQTYLTTVESVKSLAAKRHAKH